VKRESRVRLALSALFFATVGFVVLALFGWFDGPSLKADSEARKCGSARSIHLLADAERYCRNAVEIVKSEARIQREVAALVYVEAAALAIVQERIEESATDCELALKAWQDPEDSGRESTVFVPREIRQESIDACELLIAVVTRKPPPETRVVDLRQDVGARVSAPTVIMLKANDLRAQRRTQRAI
jgi:hypothetical protein